MSNTHEYEAHRYEQLTRRSFFRQGVNLAGAMTLAGTKAFAQTPVVSGSFPGGAKPGEIVFVWQTISNQNTLFRPALERWRRDSGVPHRWVETPKAEEQLQKVLAMSASGEPLDFFSYTWGSMGQFTTQRVIRPLDDLPGIEEYFAVSPSALKPLMQVNGKIMSIPQMTEAMACSYNERLLERTGYKAPAASWDEFVEHCQKARRDGVSKMPAIWTAAAGVFHINYAWYSQVASRGGTITDRAGNPTLGPGSIARDTLAWWRRTFHDWKISDPRSLQMRYYPAARAYASGEYLYSMTFLPDAFPLINGGDSPTKGQHRIFVQPGGRGLLYADVAGISATSKHPEWAWALLQYLVGRTRDGEWLGATNMATLGMSPYPRKAVMDTKIRDLWASFFGDLDTFFKALETSVSLPQLLSVAREAWYPKWTDFVVARLQDCLGGTLSADQACDAIAANLNQERGR